MQHLTALLAAEDEVVVDATLAALMVLLKKSHASSHLSSELDLNKRLLAISQGWGGKEQVTI